ncbi:MAG: hypothetical protein ACXVHW_12055 [Methanobacterium sp.]
MIKEILISYEKNKNYFINYKDRFKHQSPNNAISSYFTLVVILPIIGVFTDKHYKWRFEGKGNIMEYKDTLTKNWLEFYTYGLVKDYIAVSRVYHWYESSVILEGDDIIEVIFEYLEERYEKIAARIALNYSIKGTFYVFDICEEDDIYADIKRVKVF